MKKIYISFSLLCMSICIFAQQNHSIEPVSLSIGNNNEIFAVSYSDGVVYASDQQSSIFISRVDTALNPLFKLFYASKKDNDKWGASKLLSKKFPKNAHIGSCTISADGKEIYFSVNDEFGQRIFYAQKQGNEWTNIQPFLHNKTNCITTHPSLSRDGKRLFFVSDMPGGYGGLDIYVSERTLRGWATPKNLGPNINTPENDLYPFIQQNGELYFSSSGHNSMGGLDIFSAKETNGVWGNVERLGEPINSIYDDISYTASDAVGVNGYFASNRNGSKFDLFSFKSIFPVFNNCTEQIENDYTYVFSERYVIRGSSTFRLMWDMGDGTVKYGEVIEHTFPSTGLYTIFLSVIDTLTNEMNREVARYAVNVLDEEQPYISAVESATTGSTIIFDASNTHLPRIDIEEYYWIFGDGTHSRGKLVEHQYKKPGVYRVQLGIVGKTKLTGQPERICVYREIKIE